MIARGPRIDARAGREGVVRGARGQSLLEFALVLPLLLVLGLGVVEFGYLLLDQHVVTKLTREGSNLISRNTTLEDAIDAIQSMSAKPVNFDSHSRVIFSVLKKGARTGTVNYDQVYLYQRVEYGTLTGVASKLTTLGSGSFSGAPDFQAVNPDTTAGLQVTNLPDTLIAPLGGTLYVTEVYTTHETLTPLSEFGIDVPTTLYSIAYF
jgi:Flp pilus assembly protein TadG